MKNAIKYGAFIGVISGLWLFVMHYNGVYENQSDNSNESSWMEYASLLIPFTGLYFGIKNFRDHLNGGVMEFIEGIFEGFKILIVGGIITAFFSVIYVQYVPNVLNMDYMARIAAAGIVGTLLDLAVSLMLMNAHKDL